MNADRAQGSAGREVSRGVDEVAGNAGLVVVLMPTLAGKRVLVLGDEAPWRGAGAAELAAVDPQSASLPVADAAYDVVLIPGELGQRSDESAVPELLNEVRRALAPEGFAVIRLGPAASSGALTRALEARFASVVKVAERPFIGVFYGVPDAEEMAIAGDLADLETGTCDIAFCGLTPATTWALSESLLIPLPEQRLSELSRGGQEMAERCEQLQAELGRLRESESVVTARLAALTTETDELREALLARDDRRAESEAALLALRRETGRHLAAIAAQAERLDHVTRLHAEAERRAAAAEQVLAEVEVALRRRAMDVAALERELGRVRQRRA